MKKKYAEPLLILAAACAAGTFLISGFATLVILLTFRGTGPGEPFDYYEWLHFPLLSVALPVLGMLLLALSAPALLGKRHIHLHLTDSFIKPAHPVEARLEGLRKAA